MDTVLAAAVVGIVSYLLCSGVYALAAPPSSEPIGLLDALQQDMEVLKNQLHVMLSAVPDLPQIVPFAAARITKGYDPSHIWWIGVQLAAIFVAAGLGEAIAHRLFQPLHRLLPALDEKSDFGKLGALLVNAVIRLVEMSAFVLVGISTFFIAYDGHEAARYAYWSLFSVVVVVRLAAIVLRVLLAPSLPRLRLPQLDDATARRLYGVLLFIAAVVAASVSTSTFLYQIGLPAPLYLAFGEMALIVATLAVIAVIWGERRAITQWLGVVPHRAAEGRNDLAGLFAAQWHVFATCFLIAVAVVASVDRLVTGERQVGRILGTLSVLVGFPLIDALMRMVVRSYFSPEDRGMPSMAGEQGDVTDDMGASPTAEASRSPAEEENANATYGAVILRNARIALVVIAIVVVSRIWEFDLTGLASGGVGAHVAEAIFQIAVTLLLASSAWSIVKIAIARKLPRGRTAAETPAAQGAAGAGLSRVETLLPLLRMFVFITIVTIALMSVISALGVNIGPLLAGAGVVGIAVGFGAQTLVRDILSGVFFLVDDAFRIGEYVDVGEGKGTVERMSIRAVMLRHQLGQIYTIPFAAIRRVTNYSRDWTIMKLEIRVPFDTDLERLRKVVKDVGKELAKDPEHGPLFLQPLKSQGVNRVDESAFVVRLKFMAKPHGEAFMLRRQVFGRMQEAFHRNGIQFAVHRIVVDTVPERAATAGDFGIVGTRVADESALGGSSGDRTSAA